MRRTNVLCLAMILGAVSLPARSQGDVAGVYDAVAESGADNCPLIVASRTDASETSLGVARAYAERLGLDDAMAKAFATANEATRAINWKPVKLKVELVDVPPALESQEELSLLRRMTSKHPCVHYILSLSAAARVGMDAMVKVNRFCGGLCGGGSDVVRLHFVGDHWRVVRWEELSID